MKRIIKELLQLIKYEYLERFSFILLLLWTVSPLIEYALKGSSNYYTYYFSLMIHMIGLLGILSYVVYFLKLKQDNRINIKKMIPEILLVILLILSIIASILSKDINLSVFGDTYRKEGLIVYTMYIGFILAASIIKDTKYMKWILRTIVIAGVIITLLPLFRSNFTYLEFTNVFHNLNHYGYYLMINIMLSAFMYIENKKVIGKIIYLAIYIFFIYLLIRNDTFGSYLAIVISLLILFIYAMIKKYQRLNVVLIIIVFIVTSFTVSHFDIKIGERINFESTKGTIERNILLLTRDIKNIFENNEYGINKAGTSRGILWKEAWNYTKDHPIFGGGMECLGKYYQEKNISVSDRPHNIVLQTSSFIGIPGAIAYIVLIVYIAITNLKILDKNTIHIMIYFTAMSYFISSMFGNSMYYTSPYFMILLGLLIGFIRRKEKTRLTK